MDEDEKTKIVNYVTKHIPKQLSSFKMIMVENCVVGGLRVIDYENGILVDEIFMERNWVINF